MRYKRIQTAGYLLLASLLTFVSGYAGASTPPANPGATGGQSTAASSSSLPAGYYAMPGNESRSDFNLPQIGMAGANVLSPQQEYQIGVPNHEPGPPGGRNRKTTRSSTNTLTTWAMNSLPTVMIRHCISNIS